MRGVGLESANCQGYSRTLLEGRGEGVLIAEAVYANLQGHHRADADCQMSMVDCGESLVDGTFGWGVGMALDEGRDEK